MAFTIKEPETYRLIKELAELTGESMAQAADTAVRERLERIRSQRRTGLAERLTRIGRACAEHLVEPYLSADHAELLYGEQNPGSGLGTDIANPPRASRKSKQPS
jgi:antitoxin VapB